MTIWDIIGLIILAPFLIYMAVVMFAMIYCIAFENKLSMELYMRNGWDKEESTNKTPRRWYDRRRIK